jgi:hypothetical protein
VAWYIYNKVAQDPLAQKVGSINVVYNNGGFPKNGMGTSLEAISSFLSVPLIYQLI